MKKNLLFLSGGLDSAAMFIMALKNEPNIVTDAIHLTLKNSNNRWSQEIESCRKIIEWISNRYNNYTYKEYECEYVDLGIKDAEWVAIYSTFIINSNPNIYKKAIIGQIKNDDIFRFECNMLTRRTFVSTVLDEFYEKNSNIEMPYYSFPLRNTTKIEIINFLKQEEFPFEICFSCRDPQQNNQVCGKCLSCKHRIKAGILITK